MGRPDERHGTSPSDLPADGEVDAMAVVEEFVRAHERRGLLRFVTSGSVDDGKSTLIGRLLYESNQVYEDHLAVLAADSVRVGTQGDDLDLALLLDGLSAEREQGITIDVAHRCFSTPRRSFIVADTPGHEQYTRNMVTGASTADLALLLVDARKGVLTQTRRHACLAALLGLGEVVLVVNKMDLVGWSSEVFERIADEFRVFAARIGIDRVTVLPVSALTGANVVVPSPHLAWFDGPTLLGYLESVEMADAAATLPFRMPIQWVSRPDSGFRGFAGRAVSGVVRPGDRVRVLPAGTVTEVERIVTMDGDLDEAVAGASVTLTFADEVDVSRGDLLCAADEPCEVADQFDATLVWMHEQPLLPGRPYLMRIGTRTVGMTVGHLAHRIDVDDLSELAATTLGLNEIGRCEISTDRPVGFDPYSVVRETGGFIVIDKITQETVGAGLLHAALRRSRDIHWQQVRVDKQARSALDGHRPAVVWFTGLSGAGKSTIADIVESKLHAAGVRTYLLDGDNVRHGLNRDLGFSDADRVENIRRVAEVAALMVDAGLVVLAAFISPFRAERRLARGLVEPEEFVEVFVDAPLEVTEARDPKGLYRRARAGELKDFTGIDSPYEPPEQPEVHLDSARLSPEEAADQVIEALRRRGLVP